MSAVGPKSTADARQFLIEACCLPIEGVEFKRTPSGLMTLRCEYKTARGDSKTKLLTMAHRWPNARDEVVDLTVMMSEWITNGEGHMMELLDGSRDKETVQ